MPLKLHSDFSDLLIIYATICLTPASRFFEQFHIRFGGCRQCVVWRRRVWNDPLSNFLITLPNCIVYHWWWWIKLIIRPVWIPGVEENELTVGVSKEWPIRGRWKCTTWNYRTWKWRTQKCWIYKGFGGPGITSYRAMKKRLPTAECTCRRLL